MLRSLLNIRALYLTASTAAVNAWIEQVRQPLWALQALDYMGQVPSYGLRHFLDDNVPK